MAGEFSEQELHELVDRALAKAAMPRPEPSPVSNEIHFPEMSFLEIDLVEQFYSAMVEKGVDSKIRSEILTGLRENILGTRSKIGLDELRTRIANCRKCVEATDKPKTMIGNTINPRLLFVIASSGNDVQKLNAYLEKYGFDKVECGVTFVVRCPLQGNITETAINKCSGYLFAEIDYLQPEIIVPVGAIPLRVIAGQSHGLKDHHGKPFWLGAFRVFPLFTPTYAEKSNTITSLETDIETLKQIAYA